MCEIDRFSICKERKQSFFYESSPIIFFLAICIWHEHFLCRNVYILAPILSVILQSEFVTCVILLRRKT